MTTLRFNYQPLNAESLNTLLLLEAFIRKIGLNMQIYELIQIKASQINGCESNVPGP